MFRSEWNELSIRSSLLQLIDRLGEAAKVEVVWRSPVSELIMLIEHATGRGVGTFRHALDALSDRLAARRSADQRAMTITRWKNGYIRVV